jgi:hypothetical protein
VLVNGSASTTHYVLRDGDRVELVTAVGCRQQQRVQQKEGQQQQQQQQQQLLPGLQVAFEDDHLAIVVKPQVCVRVYVCVGGGAMCRAARMPGTLACLFQHSDTWLPLCVTVCL